jgi:hypothetical protein
LKKFLSANRFFCYCFTPLPVFSPATLTLGTVAGLRGVVGQKTNNGVTQKGFRQYGYLKNFSFASFCS